MPTNPVVSSLALRCLALQWIETEERVLVRLPTRGYWALLALSPYLSNPESNFQVENPQGKAQFLNYFILIFSC